jgi:hypothetical protein
MPSAHSLQKVHSYEQIQASASNAMAWPHFSQFGFISNDTGPALPALSLPSKLFGLSVRKY